MSAESIRPLHEPSFIVNGRQYVAHCVPDDLGMGALEVTVHEVRSGATRYVGYGVYGKRFVSYVLSAGIRRAADEAIRASVIS